MGNSICSGICSSSEHTDEQKFPEAAKTIEQHIPRAQRKNIFVQDATEEEKDLAKKLDDKEIEILPEGNYNKEKHVSELNKISNIFKTAGVNLVYTRDKKNSDLSLASLLQQKLKVVRWDMKIAEDFSMYERNKEQYLHQIKQGVAKAIDTFMDNIQVAEVTEGSVNIKLIIDNFNMENEKQNRLLSQPDDIKKELERTWNKKVDRSTITTEKTFKLSLEDFAPQYDREYTGQVLENWAGNETYIQPPKGWFGKAIWIEDPNADWIGSRDNGKEDVSHPIAYHGIRGSLDYVVPKVIKSAQEMPAGFRIGPNNAYGEGIYCSPDFNTALGYAPANDKNLQCIFQCRVDPKVLKKDTKTYWHVTDPKGIRPYRLILKMD